MKKLYTVHYTIEFEKTMEVEADNPKKAMEIVKNKNYRLHDEWIDLSDTPYINVYEAYSS